MSDNEFWILCPYCNEKLEINRNFYGRRVQCPFCENKFIAGQSSVIRHEYQQQSDIVKPGDYGISVESWRCVPMSDRIQKSNPVAFVWDMIMVLVNIILFRVRRRFLGCSGCGNLDVYFIPRTHRFFLCRCGEIHDVGDGMSTFTRRIAELKRELDASTANESIRELHAKFKIEERRFIADWQFASDERTPRRIARLHDVTDRLYQRLTACNSQKIVNATVHASASNVAWCNTFKRDSLVGSIVEMSAIDNILKTSSEERMLNSNAESLQEQIGKNEEIIDYYEDLVDEFCGLSCEAARSSRLLRIFGCASENELTPIKALRSPEVIIEDIEHCTTVSKFMSRWLARIVITLLVVFSVLLLWLLT